eukprot:GFYU01003118.1.p1 GENE.GFYU01003118.1~~GFYU01003118.1.p1  ORF type:complete len:494 (-),score=104.06 GFYU01003118.1:38-1519(-)
MFSIPEPAATIAWIYIACCTNVVTLELITTRVSNATNLVTAAQFIFVALVCMYQSLESNPDFIWYDRSKARKGRVAIAVASDSDSDGENKTESEWEQEEKRRRMSKAKFLGLADAFFKPLTPTTPRSTKLFSDSESECSPMVTGAVGTPPMGQSKMSSLSLSGQQPQSTTLSVPGMSNPSIGLKKRAVNNSLKMDAQTTQSGGDGAVKPALVSGKREKRASLIPVRMRDRHIPLHYYMFLVSLFFLVSVVNNKALDYNISLPLHMVFRSGSLMASMVLGILILSKRYSIRQYLGVLLVSAGIAFTTIATAPQAATEDNAVSEEDSAQWAIGIGMLTMALFMVSLLGIVQEYLYGQYGIHIEENMFYSHLMSLPLFGFMWRDIWRSVLEFNESPYLELPLNLQMFFPPIPSLWFFLLLNMCTQYMCVSRVYRLTGITSSLTCTMVITIRKFVSLLFSVFYFSHPFTKEHWMGSASVFAGTLLYVLSKPPPPKSA